MAQLGSALPWGGRGREFKSRRSDHDRTELLFFVNESSFFDIYQKKEGMGMDIRIRPACIDDLDAVTAIEQACFPKAEAATREQLQERLAAFQHSFLLAEKENHPVGFINGCVTARQVLTDDLYASTQLHDDTAANMMVFGLDVVPQEQHQGIAKQLMQAYIALAIKRHKALITLTCKKRLIPFYEQFGYVCQGRSVSTHGGVSWYTMTMYL